MHDDERSRDERAAFEQRAGELDREARRVGVDWAAAEPAMRRLMPSEMRPASGGAYRMSHTVDLGALLGVLRALPDGSGTDAFVAALERHAGGGRPPA
jgi:hypothetical protein